MALSGDGLFNMARKAATDYNEKSVEEKLQILYAEKIMEDNDSNTEVKTDVTDVLEEMVGGEITEGNIEEFNKLLEQYNEEVKGIKTADELRKIGTDENYPIDGVYVQLSNIEKLTTQIGSKDKPFKGVYNGNGKSIKRLEITNNEDYTGMFRANEGTIKNVTIEDCQITSEKGMIGGISGENSGLIENCTVSNGNITSNGQCLLSTGEESGSRIGGICGQNEYEGIIRDCSNSATVKGSYKLAGGICGFNRVGMIDRCENRGNVTGGDQVGGITGNSHGRGNGDPDIINCTNSGKVEASKNMDSSSYCGGIVGYQENGTIVKSCRNTGEIIGTGSIVGGISGQLINDSIVIECLNYGSVSGKTATGRYNWIFI